MVGWVVLIKAVIKSCDTVKNWSFFVETQRKARQEICSFTGFQSTVQYCFCHQIRSSGTVGTTSLKPMCEDPESCRSLQAFPEPLTTVECFIFLGALDISEQPLLDWIFLSKGGRRTKTRKKPNQSRNANTSNTPTTEFANPILSAESRSLDCENTI
jgi:hypothetical protein